MRTFAIHEKGFDQLSNSELYDIIKLRMRVFIVEQVCPYLDLDDLDQHMRHIWFADSGSILAYVRIAPPGISFEQYSSIGRVITAHESRGAGLGRKIFQMAINRCEELYPESNIKISAQYYLKGFYESFGFEMVNQIYLEDGIPHISMIQKK